MQKKLEQNSPVCFVHHKTILTHPWLHSNFRVFGLLLYIIIPWIVIHNGLETWEAEGCAGGMLWLWSCSGPGCVGTLGRAECGDELLLNIKIAGVSQLCWELITQNDKMKPLKILLISPEVIISSRAWESWGFFVFWKDTGQKGALVGKGTGMK